LSELRIYDDCSTDKNKLLYLDKISKKYTIIRRDENLGTFKNTCYAIEDCCNRYNSDMIYLQDDIILNKDWYSRGKEIYDDAKTKFKIAFFCLYNRDRKCEDLYYILHIGHPGGVAWIINKDWWVLYRELYKFNDCGIEKLRRDNPVIVTEPKIKHLVDYKLAMRVHDMRWQIGKVGMSLVQHIGDKSTISVKDMSYCRTDNFVGED
jgi:hypothetical protein